MKQLLLILLCLPMISLNNLSYASFPVEEKRQTEVSEDVVAINTETPRRQGTYVYALLSVLAALLGYFMIILAFGAAYGGFSIAITFLYIALAAMIGASVLGLIGMIKKEKGFVLSLLGFLLGILGFIMIIGFI